MPYKIINCNFGKYTFYLRHILQYSGSFFIIFYTNIRANNVLFILISGELGNSTTHRGWMIICDTCMRIVMENIQEKNKQNI